MTATIPTFNAQQTAGLLRFPELVAAVAAACDDYSTGNIQAPERQVLAFPNGGVMLSMPATAADIGIHKLVNVFTGNAAKGVPVINGVVTAYSGETGETLFALDGPTLTARRTAAVSMLGLQTFLRTAPLRVALIGTGAQAVGHVEALAAVFPQAQLIVVGSSLEKAQRFIAAFKTSPVVMQASEHVPDDVDAVITLTTSHAPVYTKPAVSQCLIIGVGAFKPELAEIGAPTLHGSQIYVDDPAGARHEAGDLIQAQVQWDRVKGLSDAIAQGVDFTLPIVFKTVGCAAWDLAAARCAHAAMNTGR